MVNSLLLSTATWHKSSMAHTPGLDVESGDLHVLSSWSTSVREFDGCQNDIERWRWVYRSPASGSRVLLKLT